MEDGVLVHKESMIFQKKHLLHRPATCTSWKVLEIADNDNQTLKIATCPSFVCSCLCI